MKFFSNKIKVGQGKSFDQICEEYLAKKNAAIKTASVKVAEADEADSSGQLDVEPLHQTGESTNQDSVAGGKSDDGGGSSTPKTDTSKDGKDSGQPKAEGSEKFTNDPKVDADAGSEAEIKEAGEKGMCDCGKPNFICKGKCKGDSGDSDDKDDSNDKDDSDDKDCTAKVDEDDSKDKEKEAKVEEDDAKAEEKDAKVDKDDAKAEEKEAKVDEDDAKAKEKEAAAKCEECKCDPCTCKDAKVDEKDSKEETKEAAIKPRFKKIANLSSKEKTFLGDFWNKLYPKDFVDSMLADK